jgi:hypothetical protein
MALILNCGLAFADGFIPDKPTAVASRKQFPMDISVLGVGTVRVDYRVTGEPVNEPAKVYLSVKCNGSNTWRPIARPIGMGNLKAPPIYNGTTKTLILRYNTCRTEPSTGDVTCDQGGQPIPFPLGDACSPNYQPPSLGNDQGGGSTY